MSMKRILLLSKDASKMMIKINSEYIYNIVKYKYELIFNLINNLLK